MSVRLALADLIPAEPPTVTVHGVDSLDDYPRGVKAALLLWGRHEQTRQWMAGISWYYRKFRGCDLSALLTTWADARSVQQRPGERYNAVERITLSGPPQQWPTLPAVYPRINPQMLHRHLHSDQPDPEGEYRHLRDAIRAFRR